MDSSHNAQWFGFVGEVLAVIDGTVAFVPGRMPEETPDEPPVAVKQLADYAIIIQLAPKVWSVYAHLQPGSSSLRMGEPVPTGQPLARLGNTGNSTAPHLHFDLSDGPDISTSNSPQFVLDRYTLAGMVTP
jgi:murein DD-endopeptidase MepM/ murein hydrolase activator NlpD